MAGLDTEWLCENSGARVSLRELLEYTQSIPAQKTAIDTLKPRLLNWPKKSREWQRVRSVDISCPDIVLKHGTTVYRIIDGHHRIHKALLLGWNSIDAKLVSSHTLPQRYRCVFL